MIVRHAPSSDFPSLRFILQLLRAFRVRRQRLSLRAAAAVVPWILASPLRDQLFAEIAFFGSHKSIDSLDFASS